jgi:hypothetical protein
MGEGPVNAAADDEAHHQAATFGLSLDDAPPQVRAGGARASRFRSE